MKTRWMVALSVGVAAAAVVPSAAGAFPSSTGVAGTPGAPGNASNAGPPEGLVHPRGESRPGGGGSNPLMTYHGGKIMPTAKEEAIFWGPSWSNPTFVGDKVTGLDQFYAGEGGSNYANTVDEYAGTNGSVTSTLTSSGHLFDTTTTAAGGGNASVILAEVAKMVPNPPLDGTGYYPVYTDVPRGHAGYCAWHSYGTVTNSTGTAVPVQFAYFFKLDGDPGCDPQDTTTGHSQGLAALANVSAHELSEARSDPASPGAWYDSSGSENGDKCAWTFNVPSVTFASNQTSWRLQGEWSNNAYGTSQAYPNRSGQDGCLNGH